MGDYRVAIRIHPYVKHRLGTSQSAELPANLELGPFKFMAVAGSSSHSVTVDVRAADGQAAILDAVAKVRDVLIVLAARGDTYAVEMWPMPTVEAQEIPPRVTHSEAGGAVAIDAVVTLTEHVGIVVRRGDYSAASAAVLARAKWPTWIRVALELNYMGEAAIEDRPALISYCSALEVITHATQGAVPAVARSLLGRQAAHALLAELIQWLRDHGFDEDQAERAGNQAVNAHAIGLSQRTSLCLKQLGVAVTTPDIISVTKTRGRVVHADQQPSDEEVRQAIGLIRGWLSTALPRLLEQVV